MKAIAAYVAKHKLRSLGTVLLITGLGIGGWILFEHQTKLQVAAPEPVFSREFGKVRHVLADGTVRSEIEFSRESLPDFEELFPEVYQRLNSHVPIAREGEHYQLELAIGEEGAPSRWGTAWVANGAEFWSNGDATFEVRGSVRDHLVHAWTWRTLKDRTQVEQYDAVRFVLGRLQQHPDRRDLLERVHRWLLQNRPKTVHGLYCGPIPEDTFGYREYCELTIEHLIKEGQLALGDRRLPFEDALVKATINRLLAATTGSEKASRIHEFRRQIGASPISVGMGTCFVKYRHETKEQERDRAAQQARAGNERVEAARQEQLAFYERWKNASAEERKEIVAAEWTPPTRYGSYPHSTYIDSKYGLVEPNELVLRGTSWIPAIERAQARAETLMQRGQLEFVLALWKGKCDRQLVTELLNGKEDEAKLGIQIITAAKDTSFKSHLINHFNKWPRSTGYPWAPWRSSIGSVVIEALLACHEREGLKIVWPEVFADSDGTPNVAEQARMPYWFPNPQPEEKAIKEFRQRIASFEKQWGKASLNAPKPTNGK